MLLSITGPVFTSITPFDLPQYFSRSGVWGAPQRTALVVVDGLGKRHANFEALRGLNDSWWRGTTVPPSGDSATIALGLRGGCAEPLWQQLARSGAAYGLITSKCADDGTSAGFLVTPQDRYDLPSVAASIALLAPPPFLVSGGFSRSLWLASNESSANFIEFDSPGSTAYAETCEYTNPKLLPKRVARAARLGIKAGGAHGLFLTVVNADVDLASHAQDEVRVTDAVGTLRTTLDALADLLADGNSGGWRIVVVGSHATGGDTGTHGHHSPAGTPVPIFVAGQDAKGSNIATILRSTAKDTLSYDEVARIVAPTLSCAAARHVKDVSAPIGRHFEMHRPDAKKSNTSQRSEYYYSSHNYYYSSKGAQREQQPSVYLFFLFITAALFFLCACSPA